MRLIHEGQALHAGLFRSTLACVETEEAEVKMNGPWVKLLDILTHTPGAKWSTCTRLPSVAHLSEIRLHCRNVSAKSLASVMAT